MDLPADRLHPKTLVTTRLFECIYLRDWLIVYGYDLYGVSSTYRHTEIV